MPQRPTFHLPDILAVARKHGASAADAVLRESIDVSVARRMRSPEKLERAEHKTLGLRVWVGDSQAVVSSDDLTPGTIEMLTRRAVAMAKVAPPDVLTTLAPSKLLEKNVPDLDLLDANEPTSEWLMEQCSMAEEAALSTPGITNSEGAEAGYSTSRVTLATSGGFYGSYASSHFALSLSVLAEANGAMERDYDYTSVHHRSELMDATALGKSAAKLTLRRLHARKMPTAQVPVVFEPRVAKQLLGTFAGAISGAAVARGTSFLKNNMGTAIFSPQVTIIDDPRRKRGMSSKPFDAEGVATRKLALVEGGTLKSWLLDVRSANKLGLTTTGHASRGVATPPSPSPTNLYMQAGTLSPQELISDIKSGFYVTETFGMGINIVTGDYSQGASGIWIENGELAHAVSEMTIAGNLKEMFMHLTPANDLEFRYGVNSPTLRIETMTVAGT